MVFNIRMHLHHLSLLPVSYEQVSRMQRGINYFQFLLKLDSRIVILGMSAILFEAAFTIYIVEWTPTIQYTSPDELPLGLGVIFSLKWVRVQCFFSSEK